MAKKDPTSGSTANQRQPSGPAATRHHRQHRTHSPDGKTDEGPMKDGRLPFSPQPGDRSGPFKHNKADDNEDKKNGNNGGNKNGNNGGNKNGNNGNNGGGDDSPGRRHRQHRSSTRTASYPPRERLSLVTRFLRPSSQAVSARHRTLPRKPVVRPASASASVSPSTPAAQRPHHRRQYAAQSPALLPRSSRHAKTPTALPSSSRSRPSGHGGHRPSFSEALPSSGPNAVDQQEEQQQTQAELLSFWAQDLDWGRPGFEVKARSDTPLAEIESEIRRRSVRRGSILSEDMVVFYCRQPGDGEADEPRPVALDSTVEDCIGMPRGESARESGGSGQRSRNGGAENRPRLFYRVMDAAAAADAEAGVLCQFHFDSSDSLHSGHADRHGHLYRVSTGFMRTLGQDIRRQGLSVDDVLERLARILGLSDRYRIELRAWGGLEPDMPLAGTAWQVGRYLGARMCRGLTVEVFPPLHYLVVRGGSRASGQGDGQRSSAQADLDLRHRTYIYHQPETHEPLAEDVSGWLCDDVVEGVHQQPGSALLGCRRRQIQLVGDDSGGGDREPDNGSRSDGKHRRQQSQQPQQQPQQQPRRRRSAFSWGSTVHFYLGDDALVEAFADSETWLLPATESCMVCCDDKAVTAFASRITQHCKGEASGEANEASDNGGHKVTLCKACLAEWIRSSLQDKAWDQLKCPECPASLDHADVRRFAAKEVFARYDTLATRAALERQFPHFYWCLAPGCQSGQIHGNKGSRSSSRAPSRSSPTSKTALPSGWLSGLRPRAREAPGQREGGKEGGKAEGGKRGLEETCPRFRCHACRASHCIRHQVPWHHGETCAEYDERNHQRRRNDRKSEKFLEKSTKECPSCHKAVYKYTGCNHITCHCGHEWCYVCRAPFVVSRYGIVRCEHLPGCTERDLFEELGLFDGSIDGRGPAGRPVGAGQGMGAPANLHRGGPPPWMNEATRPGRPPPWMNEATRPGEPPRPPVVRRPGQIPPTMPGWLRPAPRLQARPFVPLHRNATPPPLMRPV